MKLYLINSNCHYFEVKTPSAINVELLPDCCFIFGYEDELYEAVSKRCDVPKCDIEGTLFSIEFDVKANCWSMIDDRGYISKCTLEEMKGDTFEKYISQWSI